MSDYRANCRAGPGLGDKGPPPPQPLRQINLEVGCCRCGCEAWPPGSPAAGGPLGGPATRPPCSKPGKEEAPLAGTGVAIPPPPRGRKRSGGGGGGASQKLAGRVPTSALHPALCSWACKARAGPRC